MMEKFLIQSASRIITARDRKSNMAVSSPVSSFYTCEVGHHGRLPFFTDQEVALSFCPAIRRADVVRVPRKRATGTAHASM